MKRQTVNKFKLLEHKFKALKAEGEALHHKSGIYAIYNIVNNHCYVGQSASIAKRWRGHKQALRNCKHKNPYLQNAWNFYKEESFKFVVLEFCGIELLNDREQYWIERLDPDYNITKNVYEHSYVYYRADKESVPDGYIKKGETFTRPHWHLWVYGGQKNPSYQKG